MKINCSKYLVLLIMLFFSINLKSKNLYDIFTIDQFLSEAKEKNYYDVFCFHEIYLVYVFDSTCAIKMAEIELNQIIKNEKWYNIPNFIIDDWHIKQDEQFAKLDFKYYNYRMKIIKEIMSSGFSIAIEYGDSWQFQTLCALIRRNPPGLIDTLKNDFLFFRNKALKLHPDSNSIVDKFRFYFNHFTFISTAYRFYLKSMKHLSKALNHIGENNFVNTYDEGLDLENSVSIYNQDQDCYQYNEIRPSNSQERILNNKYSNINEVCLDTTLLKNLLANTMKYFIILSPVIVKNNTAFLWYSWSNYKNFWNSGFLVRITLLDENKLIIENISNFVR